MTTLSDRIAPDYGFKNQPKDNTDTVVWIVMVVVILGLILAYLTGAFSRTESSAGNKTMKQQTPAPLYNTPETPIPAPQNP